MPSLQGQTVLVTRPAQQARNLCALIAAEGGRPVSFPVLEIVSVGDPEQIKARLHSLGEYQWIIFISANAVNFALKANNGKIPRLGRGRITAIGKATAAALKDARLPVKLIPLTGFNSEGLLAMTEFQQLTGQRCLIIRGQGGRDLLAETLRQRGAEVEYLEVYKRIRPVIDSRSVTQMIINKELDALTVTSGEALHNLVMMLSSAPPQQLFRIPLVVFSGRIKVLAQSFGFRRIVVTKKPSDAAIIKALKYGE